MDRSRGPHTDNVNERTRVIRLLGHAEQRRAEAVHGLNPFCRRKPNERPRVIVARSDCRLAHAVEEAEIDRRAAEELANIVSSRPMFRTLTKLLTLSSGRRSAANPAPKLSTSSARRAHSATCACCGLSVAVSSGSLLSRLWRRSFPLPHRAGCGKASQAKQTNPSPPAWTRRWPSTTASGWCPSPSPACGTR